MQKIVNGVAQQVLGTCRCPQCIPRHTGNAVKSYHSSVGPRRMLTGSTIFATAGFAVASTMEISTKTQRRDQWNNALADVSDRLREQTLRNDQWQSRIGVDDATIAEHLRRDEEYGYLFGEDLYGDISDKSSKNSQQEEAKTHATKQQQDTSYHYPWSPGDKVAPNRIAASMLETKDGYEGEGEGAKPIFATYNYGQAAKAMPTVQDPEASSGGVYTPMLVEHDERVTREWDFDLLNEDYVPQEKYHTRPDPDMQRAANIRDKHSVELDGDGPLAYFEQLNEATLGDLDETSPELAKTISANAAMANVLARNNDFYTDERVRLVAGRYVAPMGQVVADVRSGLPDLSDSDVLLDLAVSRAWWTVNTGDGIHKLKLTRRSVHRWHRFLSGYRVTTNSVKKSERIRLCVNQLECLILESLREAGRVVGDEALTPQVQEILSTYKRNVIRREHSYLWRDLQRLYQADDTLRDYWQRPVALPLAEFDPVNEIYIPRDLNNDLRSIFRSCTPDGEGRVRTLCRVWEALNASKTTPEGFTFDILIAGLSDCGFNKLTNLAISAMRMSKLQPNEATMGIVLGHYARLKQADDFERWIRIMMGHHGAVSVYNDSNFFDEDLYKAQTRPDDTRPNDKIILRPLPNSLMFDAIIKGTLKLYGVAEALDRAKRWAVEGWGLSMISLTAIGKAAAELGERSIAFQTLQIADAISTRSDSKFDPHWGRIRLEAVPQELLDAVSRVCVSDDSAPEIERMAERAEYRRRLIATLINPLQRRNILQREHRLRIGDLDERFTEQEIQVAAEVHVEEEEKADQTIPQWDAIDDVVGAWQPDLWTSTAPTWGSSEEEEVRPSTPWKFELPATEAVSFDNQWLDTSSVHKPDVEDENIEGNAHTGPIPIMAHDERATHAHEPPKENTTDDDILAMITKRGRETPAARDTIDAIADSPPVSAQMKREADVAPMEPPGQSAPWASKAREDDEPEKKPAKPDVPPPVRHVEWVDELYY